MREESDTVDMSLAMGNETDPTRRAAHLAHAWTGDGHDGDPAQEASGHEVLSAMVAAVQARFPTHRCRRRSGIDCPHDPCRFGWELVAPDGAVVVAGIDVGALAPDGRLRGFVGFFGELPRASIDLQALCLLPLGVVHVLAGCLEDAHALAEHTLALTRRHQERGNEAYALRLFGAIAARREPPRGRARRRPLPPGPRPGRGTWHASPPGALPPGSRHPLCQAGTAGASAH
jgi:hypothetical protein